MKFRKIFGILIPLIGCLTACQNAPGDTAVQSDVPSVTTAAPVTAAETIGEPAIAESDTSPGIATGYQFAEGLGICEPGNPVIYEMDRPAPDPVTNEYANVRVTNVFYQDTTMVVEILLEDHSVSLLPADEVALILEKEREDQLRQERGEAVTWDNRYFCIDEEEHLYGQSAFWNALNHDDPAGHKQLIDGKLYPPGIAGSGYGFNHQSHHTSYAEDENGWYTVVKSTLRLSNAAFTGDELAEAFELRLDGFEESIQFYMEKAKEVTSLAELPGWTEGEDVSFLVTGVFDERERNIVCYPYQKDGYRVFPVTAELSYRTEDGKEYRQALYDHSGQLDTEIFAGLHGSGMMRYLCEVPEDHEIQEASLVLRQAQITTEEWSDLYPIPIPESETELDMKVEFTDGTLYLTSVAPMREKINMGQDTQGEEILKPGIYLTARAESKTEAWQMGIVYGFYAEEIDEDKKQESFYYGKGMIFPDVTDALWHECEIKGYKIAYEPGADEVDVLFGNPSYLLEQEFVLPVNLS